MACDKEALLLSGATWHNGSEAAALVVPCGSGCSLSTTDRYLPSSPLSCRPGILSYILWC